MNLPLLLLKGMKEDTQTKILEILMVMAVSFLSTKIVLGLQLEIEAVLLLEENLK